MKESILNKILGIVLLIFVTKTFSIFAVASDSTLRSPADSVLKRSAKETGKLFFWEVSSDKNVIYILGSVHYAKASMYPLDPSVLSAYKKCQKVVVESDETDPNIENRTIEFMEKNVGIPSEETLDDYLSDVEIKTLEKMLPEDLPYEYAKFLRPWYLGIILVDKFVEESDYKSNLGIDLHFTLKAKNEQKEILSLEEPETAMQALIPEVWGEEIELLKEMLQEDFDYQEYFDKLFDLWNKGDAEGLYQLIVIDEINKSIASRNFIIRLNNDRNIAWIPKIEGFLKSDVLHFVIMGAGHTLGDEGVINLLSDKGYRVRRFDKTISE